MSNFKSRTMANSAIVLSGLLALAAPTAQGQQTQYPGQQTPYDEGYARPRDLVALQDDLRLLDDSLVALPRRHARQQEFQRRADEIRTDVSALAAEMDRTGTYRDANRSVRRAEVTALRQTIAVLRDDVEIAMTRRRGNSASAIPAGTEIQIMLDQGLSSRTSNPEDRVEASTVTAVQRNGRTIIPAGATVSGVVREVRSRDRGQKDAYLKLEFDTLTTESGQRMAIRSQVVSISETRSGDHTLRNGGLGALLGGVLGGIIDGKKGALIGAAVGAGGGVLATKGENVDLPEGTLITLRLDAPVTLARR